MIRRVAFGKAVLAGIVGALAWEVIMRAGLLAGLPLFDLVRDLGSIAAGSSATAWLWWPAGFALHAMVGAIWAVFYAYFFWSDHPWPPYWQGMIFSLGPMILAGLVMVPQLALMQPVEVRRLMVSPGVFAWRTGWGGPVTIVIGHLIYGFTIGCLYVRPVGHRTGRVRRIKFSHPKATSHPRPDHTKEQQPVRITEFMFATGIECSYPTINGGRWRMDELELTDHYRWWRRDLELVRELGLKYLRYGPPLHLVFQGPGRYDWDFTDAVSDAMQDLGIVPIMDLCHFGLPDWLGDFQNPEFPACLAEYAGAFARRYPWVALYTPVNEMYVTARMSTMDGVWNEQLRTETAFVTAVRHVAKASVLITQTIARERPDAIFVNSESSEFYQPCCPDAQIQHIADFENQRRFIALDLLYGAPARPDVRAYLLDHGMPAEEYDWFMRQDVAGRAVLGLDYYQWNEKMINSDGHPESLGELFGWYVITKQYYERYHRPLMHTETNYFDGSQAPGWLWRQWHNVQLMRKSGVPVVGFTWYSLQDQVDWNSGLGRPEGHVNPVGLFDLNRDPRPVAQAYAQVVRMFGNDTALTTGKALFD